MSDVRARRVLIALCVTVTTSYGVLFYAFAVLAPDITEDTGWSTTAVTTAFSIGNLVGALTGIAVGRLIQARGPRLVMTVGGILGTAAISMIATAQSLSIFVSGWLLAGCSTCGLFYSPAFAALTHWYGAQRVRAITTLSLAAGFASTIFAPLTAYLSDHLGWRDAYLVLAAVLLVITVPAHYFTMTLPWTAQRRQSQDRPDRAVYTSKAFLLVTGSGMLAALAMYASIVHLVALLREQGMTVQLAAWILGISGAGQVGGRVFYPWFNRRFSPRFRAATIIGVLAVTLLALSVAPPAVALVTLIAVLSGAARGLFTLINATVVSDYWGTERYAALNGVYNAPLGVATALSPAVGAAIAAATDFRTLFAILGVIAILSAALAARAHVPASVNDAAAEPAAP